MSAHLGHARVRGYAGRKPGSKPPASRRWRGDGIWLTGGTGPRLEVSRSQESLHSRRVFTALDLLILGTSEKILGSDHVCMRNSSAVGAAEMDSLSVFGRDVPATGTHLGGIGWVDAPERNQATEAGEEKHVGEALLALESTQVQSLDDERKADLMPDSALDSLPPALRARVEGVERDVAAILAKARAARKQRESKASAEVAP